ncbi:MAG: hypothetical protein RLZZ420_1797, partial [Bacteroidota bacterium]
RHQLIGLQQTCQVFFDDADWLDA